MLFSDNNEQVAPLDGFPWSPFCSKEDFELAELAHAAAPVVLNRNLKNVRDVPRFDLRLFSRLV